MRDHERVKPHGHTGFNDGGLLSSASTVAATGGSSGGGGTVISGSAADIAIADTGANFAATNVEDALAELAGQTIGALDDIPDVDAAAPSDGDVLTFDSGTSEWVAAAPAAASGDVATDTIWDAAGDLAVGSGANTAAKLAAGSEGDVLTITSGVPAWEAPVASGALTYIGTTALGSDGTTISYSSISGSYKDLIVVARLRGTSASAGIGATLRVGNGSVDTGSNYGFTYRYYGWTTGASNNANTTNMTACPMPNSGATSGFWGYATFEFLNYASSSISRGILGRGMTQDGSGILMTEMAGHWKNVSAAIDILTFTATTGNFLTGSTIYLYGRS